MKQELQFNYKDVGAYQAVSPDIPSSELIFEQVSNHAGERTMKASKPRRWMPFSVPVIVIQTVAW